MSAEERLEAIVNEMWDSADMFAGEDESLRPLLGKLSDSIARLWTAIDKGQPCRVALAALVVYRRLDDVFRPLEEQEREDLAEHERHVRKRVAAMIAAKRASAEPRQEVLAEYDKLRLQGRNKSYAKVQAASKHVIGVRTLERWLAERADDDELDKQRAADDELDKQRAGIDKRNDLGF